ncbi:MAG: HAD hydrolase family protein, partial [Selenomonas bovis]|nr:HAD hydrolase family protein [Selenomonas bovis]
MIKLIALDLDGTLLNSEKRVTPYTRDVLRRVMARGVHVTLATGRMIGGAAYFGRQVGVNAPLICCNGGVVQGMDAPEP